jgi:hypothetical protein
MEAASANDAIPAFSMSALEGAAVMADSLFLRSAPLALNLAPAQLRPSRRGFVLSFTLL